MSYLQLYGEGESLRLAARAIYRQARKRAPLHRPPCSWMPESLPKFEKWLAECVLPIYQNVEVLTRAEERADERWLNAVCNASAALIQRDKERKAEIIEEAELDPYGHCTWTIGDGNDFVALDWGIAGDKYAFRSVVNSETGSFIEEHNFESDVDEQDAVQVAIGFVDEAYEWCRNNNVLIDDEGNNYAQWRFVEDVKKSTGGNETNPFRAPPQD